MTAPRLDRAISGQEIRRLRVALGMSQEYFAFHAGLSKSTVANAEQGRSTLSRLAESAIKHLAVAHGVDMDGRAL